MPVRAEHLGAVRVQGTYRTTLYSVPVSLAHDGAGVRLRRTCYLSLSLSIYKILDRQGHPTVAIERMARFVPTIRMCDRRGRLSEYAIDC